MAFKQLTLKQLIDVLVVLKGQTSPPCSLLNAFWLPPSHLIIAYMYLLRPFDQRQTANNLNECEQASNEFKLLGFIETPQRCILMESQR
jgi:hypothetical protein